MKTFWLKLKEWWMERAPRERQALMIAAIFILIFVFYSLIWSPLIGSLNEMRHRLIVERETLRWMQNADKRLKLLEKNNSTKPTALSSIELLSIIKTKAKTMSIANYLTQLNEAEQDAIAVQFHEIGFDQFMQFLIELTKAYPIEIIQCNITKGVLPGVVNIELVVKSP